MYLYLIICSGLAAVRTVSVCVSVCVSQSIYTIYNVECVGVGVRYSTYVHMWSI